MKFQLFTFVLVVAGAFALPPASDVVVVDSPNPLAPRFIVEGQIRRALQQISQGIRDAGLDPLVIENEEFFYMPVPFFVRVNAFIRDLRFSDASDIRVHSLNYNHLFNRLRFDISLPQLNLTIGDSGIHGSIFNNKIGGQFKGSLIIDSIGLSGEVHVRVGIISGITLRSVSLNLRLGGIRSNLSLSVLENDFSELLNSILNESIPKALEENRADINRLLEDIFRDSFDRLV